MTWRGAEQLLEITEMPATTLDMGGCGGRESGNGSRSERGSGSGSGIGIWRWIEWMWSCMAAGCCAGLRLGLGLGLGLGWRLGWVDLKPCLDGVFQNHWFVGLHISGLKLMGCESTQSSSRKARDERVHNWNRIALVAICSSIGLSFVI